jgi:hypothetical protein
LWTDICPISGSNLSPSHCRPFCLSSICLMKFAWRSAPCSSPLLLFAYSTPPPLLCVSFQFLVYCSVFFLQGGGSVCPGAMLVYPMSSWGNTVWCLALICLVCQMSLKQVWSWCLAAREPFCFLSVTWYAEALYRLGVLPNMVLVSQQDFWFMEFMLSFSAP